jgi:K(+)-stimulated pyrophosphate-energized sodium pump
VGDPFKDTSGPSMNILIKLSSLVGLAIAPLIAVEKPDATHEHSKIETEKTIEIKVSENKVNKEATIAYSSDFQNK